MHKILNLYLVCVPALDKTRVNGLIIDALAPTMRAYTWIIDRFHHKQYDTRIIVYVTCIHVYMYICVYIYIYIPEYIYNDRKFADWLWYNIVLNIFRYVWNTFQDHIRNDNEQQKMKFVISGSTLQNKLVGETEKWRLHVAYWRPLQMSAWLPQSEMSITLTWQEKRVLWLPSL